MQRKKKLIYKILKYVEKEHQNGPVPVPEFDDYSETQVCNHVKLCEEAGYLDIFVSSHDKKPESIIRLTWNGHNALDSLRQEFNNC